MTYNSPGDQPQFGQPQQPYQPYPQQPYGYGAPPPPAPQGNGLAIAALVCGIVGILLAIIFGGIGLSRANRGAPHRGLAMAGLVLGVIDIIIFIAVIAWVSNHGGFVV
jgi:hypothetical protein